MDHTNRRATLDDVANAAGVSRSTASRALAGKPKVAPAVRQRVQLIAEALDYRPNRAARSLAGARSSLFALVMGATNLSDNPYTAQLVDAIAQAAERADHGLLLVMSDAEPARAVRNLLRDGMVDGIIVSATVFGEPWVDALFDTAIPVVAIGQHPTRTDFSEVRTENVESSAALVTYLFDSGCRRVGLIAGPDMRVDAEERRAGFELAHQRLGVDLDPELIEQGDFVHHAGRVAAHALLDRGVDGIFAANDLSAFGAYTAIAERGLTVAVDVSLVGFDGAMQRQLMFPALTTMLQPFDEIATTAIDRLLVDVPTAGRTIDIVDPTLFVGDTTRQPTSHT